MTRPVEVWRSPFCPPGKMIVIDPDRFADDPVYGPLTADLPKMIVVPEDVGDDIFARAEEMVKAHNDFQRASEWIERTVARNFKPGPGEPPESLRWYTTSNS